AVLAEGGTRRALVVHGADGLDEITTTGETQIAEVREGVVRTSRLRPEDFGGPRATLPAPQGGDREENAQITRRSRGGEPGPRRDIVLVNAAAALVVGGKAHDFKDGVAMAAASVDSGGGGRKLAALAALSHRLAPA